MAEPVALAALALEAALGWPAWLHARVGHPVGVFARLIAACAARWNRGRASRAQRKAAGVFTVVLLVGMAGLAAAAIETAATVPGGTAGWLVCALFAWPGLAVRSLDDHVRPVIAALGADDLLTARKAVGRIVGRDTSTLDPEGVARAGIESLAESFCDGVIAPLFWLLVAGLPGLWICKAINTADSLIGHIEEPWRDFGWAAARSDDAVMWAPARIAAVLLCLAGPGGWRTLWRWRGAHASPNAGWSEAAMAGAAGVRLGGPVYYEGELAARPWIGEGTSADLAALLRARRIYLRACALAAIIAGGVAWLG